ncbi:MAG: VacB/RNase II family 3'-5' exoribonuclease [Alphaproteobacteria bacterium]
MDKPRFLPSAEELSNFLKSKKGLVSKRELFQTFQIKGTSQKMAFKRLLASLGTKKKKDRPFKKSFTPREIPSFLIGQVHKMSRGIRFVPADRKVKGTFFIQDMKEFSKDQIGTLFKAKILPGKSDTVKLLEPLGADPKDISGLVLAMLEIPKEFPAAVLDEANTVSVVPPLGKREDIRHLNLVTIDGRDSRDFDDAVWAEPDKDPKNPNGWHLIVAIADVAHYVSPGTALDREAYHRGTSVYFPDKVIPMLPETLSNGVCSLNPDVDRACVGVHLWIAHDGSKLRHQFFRGLMRSAARLTYEDVQKVHDTPLMKHPQKALIQNLFRAYNALAKASTERGTLKIESDEPYIIFDDKGVIKEMMPKPRLISHQLIEEFMVLANVAAAEHLKKHNLPCLYRVHDTPDPEKTENLKFSLRHLGVKTSGPILTPYDFTKLFYAVQHTPVAPIVNDLILRCQKQAVYGPHNIGHFGLNLKEYCHFTSPIRRYPDILVHRGLLTALGLDDDLPDKSVEAFEELGRSCSASERRAVSAERDAMDRYMASYFAPKIGEVFTGYISTITHAGLFVKVNNVGATGFIPMGSMRDDFYIFKENPARLEGRRRRKTFNLGDTIKAKLIEADLVRGRLLFGF